MLPRPLRLSLLAAIVVLCTAGPTFAAPADDLREAQKLYAQGRVAPALEKVDAYLKAQPREPQGRFLKGLLLTEQKKVQEAIQVFTGLTEDFPELPEPYNNLAVYQLLNALTCAGASTPYSRTAPARADRYAAPAPAR